MQPIDRPADLDPAISAMTERAFWIAIARLPEAEQARALTLFRHWRFALDKTRDGRPPHTVAHWHKTANACGHDLASLLASRPNNPPPHFAQISALRNLAITAARRGAIQ